METIVYPQYIAKDAAFNGTHTNRIYVSIPHIYEIKQY